MIEEKQKREEFVIILYKYKHNTHELFDDENNEIRYWYKYWKQLDQLCPYPYDKNMSVYEYEAQQQAYKEACDWVKETLEEFKIYKRNSEYKKSKRKTCYTNCRDLESFDLEFCFEKREFDPDNDSE